MNMKETDQISCTRFLEKYGGLSLNDIDLKSIYTLDHEDILFVNKHGYDLTGNTDETYGTSTYYKYFFIHDNLFDQVLATNQNDNISLNIIPKMCL